MRKVLPVAVIALSLVSCFKNNEDPNRLNETDKNFLAQSFLANKAEIQAGQVALNKSRNNTVKEFAQAVVSNYTVAQANLQTVIDRLNFVLTDTITFQGQASVSYFSELNGYSFDTAYIGSRVRSHQTILNRFQQELNEGNNPYVRYYYVNRHIDNSRIYYLRADSISRIL